jgi:hemerythrin-like domain-containing protein
MKSLALINVKICKGLYPQKVYLSKMPLHIRKLMIEHRLIERMITLINQKLNQIETTNQVDPLFIDTIVDFIKIYADRTHHGKEEDILFRKLSDKEDQLMLREFYKFDREMIHEKCKFVLQKLEEM